MSSPWQEQKQAVLTTSQEMSRKSLVVGRAGNVSMRLGDGELMAITPSRKYYDELQAEDIQVVDFDGEPIEGDQVPSVETLMHAASYRARPDIKAFVHTHSLYASVLAVGHLELPPLIDELVASVGGEVKVTQYAFPSTEELAANVAAGLAERNAILLANHGLVGVGETLREALNTCEVVEHAAHIYVMARALDQVNLLPSDIIDLEKQLYRMARLKDEPNH